MGSIQACFYNGWMHDHCVTKTFVFCSSGLIVACTIINPDNVHDSQCTEQGGVYENLEEQFQRMGGKYFRMAYEVLISIIPLLKGQVHL
jgi:hypothetical protein